MGKPDRVDVTERLLEIVGGMNRSLRDVVTPRFEEFERFERLNLRWTDENRPEEGGRDCLVVAIEEEAGEMRKGVEEWEELGREDATGQSKRFEMTEAGDGSIDGRRKGIGCVGESKMTNDGRVETCERISNVEGTLTVNAQLELVDETESGDEGKAACTDEVCVTVYRERSDDIRR